MPPRGETITLSELRRRIEAGGLTREELPLYFEPDEKRSKPLAPALKLTKRVDKEGRRPSARTVTTLYFDVEAKLAGIEPPSAGRARTTVAAAKMRVLAEGDSWFRLPNFDFPFAFPDDLVDVLRKTYDIPKLAMWGDEMGDMVTTQKRNYLVPLGSGLYRHFMFSGGGNDVLASVGDHVKRFGAAGTNPADANSYIKASFETALTTVIGHYGTLAGHVRSVTNPKATLYVHGYAHARPRPGGRYIGAKLEALGFDATSSLARNIVAAMVDRFNVRLKAFAGAQNAAHPTFKVVYVNLRPAFTAAADWHSDEIHPSDRGAAKAGALMGDKIAENVPVA
jgi:hypothetical protein